MKTLFHLLFFIFTSASLIQAQICGTLGENIFASGDFGSGVDNVVQTDPNLAPGYMYTTEMPPNDGYYTISNNIDEWPNAFGWARIEDNSPDPDGYMMIVNATYDPGLFYTQVVDNLCDNILYEFSVDIYNLINQGGNLILPDVSFLIDGVIVYSTGNVPENNNWNNYGFSFYTEPGQTSITLSLQNNAPGGLGNDIALDNISFRACGDEALIIPLEIENICEDGLPFPLNATVTGTIYDTPAFQWQQSFDMGQTWNNIIGANGPDFMHTEIGADFYYYRYLLANGPTNLLNPNCRVVSNVKILEYIPKVFMFSDTICEGLIYNFNDTEIIQSGIYLDSLLNYFGCDSLVTLNLVMVPDPEISADFIVENPLCSDDEYGNIVIENIQNTTEPFQITVNDEILSESSISSLSSGNYNFIITDQLGCAFDTTIHITDFSPLVLDIGDNLEISLGENIMVSPVTNKLVENYFWEPSELFDCNTQCPILNWAPISSTLINLTVEDEFGCFASDSIWVRVEEGDRNIFLANIFSPNNDGMDDVFFIQSNIENLSIRSFLIFDRWGNKVFSQTNFIANDQSHGWNGRYKNNELASGVYVYLIEFEDVIESNKSILTGDITLLR